MKIKNLTWIHGHTAFVVVIAGMIGGTGSVGAQEMSVVGSRQTAGNPVAPAMAETSARWRLPGFWTEAPSAGAYALTSWLARLDELRNGLEKNHGFIGADDEATIAMLFDRSYGESLLLRKVSHDPVQARGEIPDTFYTIVDAKVDALTSEMARLASRFALPVGEDCAEGLQRVIADAVLESQPNATVIGTLLAGDKWKFRVNELGIPKARTRPGYVLYKVPGQPLSVCRRITVQQPYFASDDAWSTYSVKLGDLRLQ